MFDLLSMQNATIDVYSVLDLGVWVLLCVTTKA